MQKYNVEIIKLAREARFITQEELSQLLNIEQGTLSKVEKGILLADEGLIEKISKILDFPITFFYQEKKVIPVEGHYRRKISLPVKQMKQYIAQMTIAEWHLSRLMDEVELLPPNLPTWDVTKDGDPSMCARYLREFWKVPRGRIDNLTKLIEDNGIIIIPLDLGELDGFSTYFNGNIPVIFINKKLPPDRYRLTLAHEKGHLIMHFGNKVGQDRDLEKEAFQHGIEFLVPESQIRQYFSKVTIEKLADLKAYWYVSMQALLRYSNTLGMVKPNQYRYLWMQMGSLGYRRNEPVKIPSEKPSLISEIINVFITSLGYSKQELATVLETSMKDLEKFYFESENNLRIIRGNNQRSSTF